MQIGCVGFAVCGSLPIKFYVVMSFVVLLALVCFLCVMVPRCWSTFVHCLNNDFFPKTSCRSCASTIRLQMSFSRETKSMVTTTQNSNTLYLQVKLSAETVYR